MYRVESEAPPLPSQLLSSASTSVGITSLGEKGVLDFIEASLNSRVSNGSALANFLWVETAGSPLFLRTLLATLVRFALQFQLLMGQVRDGIVYFDYETLVWRFDGVGLQSHLSDAGVDSYFERLIQSLNEPTLKCLFVSLHLGLHH